MKTLKPLMAIVLSFMICVPCFAQKSDHAITVEKQKQIVDKAFMLLKEHYIFPDKIAQMETAIRKKFSQGAYASFSSAETFLKTINADLETLSNDHHIDIFFDPVRVKQIQAEENNSEQKRSYAPEFIQRAKYENYMMRKAERLDGNIGYLKFQAFVDTALSGKTLDAAMNFLSNSNAIIIDLRQNGGGDAATVSYLLGYFLPDSTLIMQARNRNNEVRLSYIDADHKRIKFQKDIPLFILTGKRTASAAEAFAYTLQSYKRAVVIGDTTLGEANPGYLFAVNNDMYIMIPAFENINPVTKTNWQSKGVYPDVPVNAESALLAAEMKAADFLSIHSSIPELKSMYRWMADGYSAELKPFTVQEEALKGLSGSYADQRHIMLANGSLFYYRGIDSNSRKRMIPMKDDLFAVEGVPYFRIRVIRNNKNEVIAMEGIYDDGQTDRSDKL
jgi:hypothetical protein